MQLIARNELRNTYRLVDKPTYVVSTFVHDFFDRLDSLDHVVRSVFGRVPVSLWPTSNSSSLRRNELE